jgi:indole-3-glycerol phosphate synthase
MRDLARTAPSPLDFRAALGSSGTPGVIAEIKMASPSRGVLSARADVGERAALYEAAGACAVSAVTEEDAFRGRESFLPRAKAACSVPVLRKDFIFDPWQIPQSRALGADAVLLIAAVLPGETLAGLLGLAREYGMEGLVEVHTEQELGRALEAGARVVGINNRNLRTMEVDLSATERLASQIPGGITVVSASGVRNRADAVRMSRAGAHAVLVGEALMRSPDPGGLIRELCGGSP